VVDPGFRSGHGVKLRGAEGLCPRRPSDLRPPAQLQHL
jgi:hypothetical protein